MLHFQRLEDLRSSIILFLNVLYMEISIGIPSICRDTTVNYMKLCYLYGYLDMEP